ncbi:MAG: Fe3+/spermidine/putrescine ABC transporter ATP-binding protein [Gammaproteobacteria bacterium]|nr:MAG: Fe3+/spermidine/putrescine ABC transporter ATP-binding protein [Gammaproteobacteria bacterium]
MNTYLLVENLTVKRGNFELKGITFDTPRGSITVILGPSGSGKSTLLETVAGFIKPLRGSIKLEGEDITDLPPEKRKIAVVYQDFALFPHLNVFENIAFGLKKLEKNPFRVKKEVLKIAKELKIDHLLKRSAHTLSGGEKQRVALARALAVRPKLLLLDEPFSALDPQNKGLLRTLIRKLVKERGVTTLCVTHDVTDAQNLGEQIIVLAKGELLEKGTPQEVFFKPKNPFVARFLEVNTLEGRVLRVFKNLLEVEVANGQTWEVSSFEGDPKEGDKVLLLFRPEFVKPCGNFPKNRLRCKVKGVTYGGFFVKLFLNCSGREIKAVFPLRELKGLDKEICIEVEKEFIHARR